MSDQSWSKLTERQKSITIRDHLLKKEFDAWWHSLSPRQKYIVVERDKIKKEFDAIEKRKVGEIDNPIP